MEKTRAVLASLQDERKDHSGSSVAPKADVHDVCYLLLSSTIMETLLSSFYPYNSTFPSKFDFLPLPSLILLWSFIFFSSFLYLMYHTSACELLNASTGEF